MVGMQNDTATLGNGLLLSCKAKCITVCPNNPTPEIYPREIKTYVHTKTVYKYP